MVLQGLKVDRGGRLAGTSPPPPAQPRRIALLARPRRIELPRYGLAQLMPLDGGRKGFAWDRIVLTADMPERTRLLISTATTDANLEEAQIADLPASASSAPLEIAPENPPEVLVQSVGGRYLWLRIEMFGDGTRTPRVTRIDVFGPRRSSLADLPAPFHEDTESAAFLDRFLGYFDTVFAEISARQAWVPALLDPVAVPSGPFLDWLGSWFDLEFLPEWPEATRRAMVADGDRDVPPPRHRRGASPDGAVAHRPRRADARHHRAFPPASRRSRSPAARWRRPRRRMPSPSCCPPPRRRTTAALARLERVIVRRHPGPYAL